MSGRRSVGLTAPVALALATLLALGTSGCGGTSAGGPGEVVVYTSVDQVYAEPVLKDFEASTGIRVRAVYDAEAAKTTGLVNRLIAERDRPRADVWWSGEIVQTLKLAEEGVLTAYEPSTAEDIPANLRDPAGLWTGFGGRARVLLVNGKSAAPVPSSILDLERVSGASDEAITRSGRAGMSDPVFGTAATQAAALYALWGPEEAKAFYQTVAAGPVTVLQGNGDVRDRVVSGELDWGLTDTDDTLSAVEKGADVRIVVPDQEDGGLGALLIPNTVALVAEGPNRSNAERLADYLLSADVESALTNAGWIQFPVRGAPDPRVSEAPVRFMDVDWDAAYAQLATSSADMRELFLR